MLQGVTLPFPYGFTWVVLHTVYCLTSMMDILALKATQPQQGQGEPPWLDPKHVATVIERFQNTYYMSI